MAIYELNNKKPTLPNKGSYWIASNATVIGDVELHEGSSIWFNTVVRGDCEKIQLEQILMYKTVAFFIMTMDTR